jgi:hypothetical protein
MGIPSVRAQLDPRGPKANRVPSLKMPFSLPTGPCQTGLNVATGWNLYKHGFRLGLGQFHNYG